MDLINDRPRKVLGYRTPREVFLAQSGAVALQTCMGLLKSENRGEEGPTLQQYLSSIISR